MTALAAYPQSHLRELQRQNAAALLQHTYRWVSAASATAPMVAQQAAPMLTLAAQLYEAAEFDAALQQLSGAVMALRQARQAYPALPPL